MEYRKFNNLEDLLGYLGYEKDDDNENSECEFTIDPTGGAETNCCRDLNSDLVYGYQDLSPMLFITIGELVGNVLSGQLPFNVANSISNFLNLVGQIIETYGAQIQYYEVGPGRYFNPALRNSANPYFNCVNPSEEKIERLESLVSNLITQAISDKTKISELEKQVNEIVMKDE